MEPDSSSGAPKKDGAFITIVKGCLVGIANIIPGVSGGTFALILGIFDRLIGAINAINLDTLKAVVKLVTSGFSREGRDGIANEWRRLDATFLTLLFLGAGAAIWSSSFLISYLLNNHYSPTLAFFIGLILPSIAIPWAMMDERGLRLLWIVPGAALTVGVSLVIPDAKAGLDNLAVAFGTGAVAISAMILPGISGSYVMLVLGQYQNVLNKLTNIDVPALIWFGALALGMGVGLIVFARFLHFLLARFRSATMAFLIGLLVGSLWILWPFKDIDAGAEVRDRQGEVKEEIKIATAPNRMPEDLTEGLAGGGALAGGFVISLGLLVVDRRRKESES
jgi:putative membrane protein